MRCASSKRTSPPCIATPLLARRVVEYPAAHRAGCVDRQGQAAHQHGEELATARGRAQYPEALPRRGAQLAHAQIQGLISGSKRNICFYRLYSNLECKYNVVEMLSLFTS